jgi:hypothetical protein
VAGVFVFWPRLNLTVNPTDISAGQPVELQWTSWPPILMTLKLNGVPLGDTRGELIQHPLATIRYQLTGDTWASRLFSPGKLFSVTQTVNVTPVTPQILLFQAQPPQVDSGAYTEISWSVTDADKLVLVSESFSQTLESLGSEIRLKRPSLPKAYTPSRGPGIEQVLTWR